MSDNLEKFINENRPAFDDKPAPKDLWSAIDHQLEQNREKQVRRIPVWRYASVAAAAVLLIGTGVLIGLNVNNQASEAVALFEVFPEYSEMEQYYKKEVNTKVARLAKFKHDAAINEDLKQLDKTYEELQKELSEAPKDKQEQIINALIVNYRTKLSILERVLERLESTNQKNLKPTNNDSTEI